jgi:hypothetical protein
VTEFVVSLHPGQAAIYNSPARFKVCAAGRRFGKSHLGALTLGIEALRTTNERGYTLTREHGVYYVAPTFDQAKRIMWPKLRELLGYERTGGLISNENTNDGWLELINGRRIYIKGADNPDSLRGIGLSYVVLDEYADMKPNVWTEIIAPSLMDVEGAALFIGTPKGKNHFYKLFMQALAYVHDPITEDYPVYEAFHFTSMDNPFLRERELKRMMEGDDRPLDTVRQEIEASFISGGGKVLKPEWFKIVTYSQGSAKDPGNGSTFITVDLAGFKKQEGNKVLRTDESVISVTYVTEEGWTVLDMQHGHWDPRETALRIIRTVGSYPGCRLGIEKGALMNAVGPYLNDYMREFNRYVTPDPLTHGNNKKSDRIQWALQGRAERGKIKLVKGDWNNWLLEQISDFPDPLAHDDGIDALAYVDQMATTNYADPADIEEWEPLDMDSGY